MLRFFPSLFVHLSPRSSPSLFPNSVSLLLSIQNRKSLESHRIQRKPIESLPKPHQTTHFLPLSARSTHRFSSFPHFRLHSPLLHSSSQRASLYSHHRPCDQRLRRRYSPSFSFIAVGLARVWSHCSQSWWKSLLLAGYGIAT